ncbi:MAG: hypothetical protein BGN91_02410 [Nitrobacter sp. 62-13]|nr:MAG: hypothetical protein BGN91_02410 [Nitrobacter sp. 62-13]
MGQPKRWLPAATKQKRAVRATTIMKKIDVAGSRSTMELTSSEVAPKANSIELENIAVGHSRVTDICAIAGHKAFTWGGVK